MTEEKNIVPAESLDLQAQDVVSDIISEQDGSKLRDLTALFNLVQSKKNIVRAAKFSELLDKISDQMLERVSKHAGEFNNRDLLDYLQTIKATLDKTDNYMDIIKNPVPIIQQNNSVNINMGDDNISRESRERVAEAIRAILGKFPISPNSTVIDIPEVEIEGDNTNDNELK